jgi:membrane-associated phospholipid phosphatase
MNETIILFQAVDPSLLDRILWWGVAVIQAIQTIASPALTAFIKVITGMGSQFFYIPLIFLVFWCADERQGFRLGALVLLSAWINDFFKTLFRQPRPFNLEPSVALDFEPTYGFPSGHAQQSLVFWGAAASALGGRMGKFPARILAAFFILLIGFTRLYLGLHFPTDLLGGWVLGILILLVSFLLGARIEALLLRGGMRVQMVVVAALTLLMNTMGTDAAIAGMFLGFGLGYALMIARIRFAAQAPINPGGKRPGIAFLCLRCVFGALTAGAIYLVLNLVFPGEGSLFAAIPGWGPESPYQELGRFIRYGCLGFWVSAGAPWFFVRLKIAGTRPGGEAAAPAEG